MTLPHAARARRAISTAAMLALLSTALSGCTQTGANPNSDSAASIGADSPDRPTDTHAKPLPTYIETAQKYNQNASRLSRIFVGGAVVRVTFTDDQGASHREQVEGTLQMIRPAKLALNIRKVGQSLFWLGSDTTRYWWFDLTGDTKYAVIGTHAGFDQDLAKKIGLSIHPLELIRAMGVVELPTTQGTMGGTQWSSDETLLGIAAELSGTDAQGGSVTGFVRVWVDPADNLPRKIELFDVQKQLVIRAEHSEPATVTMHDQPVGPSLASRIVVTHVPSGAVLDMSLADATDGHKRLSEKAFDFDQVKNSLKPEKVYDLDEIKRQRTQKLGTRP
ncbi:MAG: hypothetical protein IBJ18_04360 [Phycisphaerales bacterium]|nr:hypothetical protein [Phycisphaerales bacterium]